MATPSLHPTCPGGAVGLGIGNPAGIQSAEVQGTFTNVKAFEARSSWEFKFNRFEFVYFH